MVRRGDLSYDRSALARYILHAVPLLVLLLALFGFAVELLDVEPRHGAVIRLALLEQPRVPAAVVFGTWLMESAGLVGLYLLARGRCGAWWLDGLVTGWIAWIFRGPLLVITIVIAARQPQEPWWTLAFGWWVLYSICGLSLAVLARRQDAADKLSAEPQPAAEVEPRPAIEAEAETESEDNGEAETKDKDEIAEPDAIAEPDEIEIERDATPVAGESGSAAGESGPAPIDPGVDENAEER